MRLVHAAKVIKKSVYIFFGVIFLAYTGTTIIPQLWEQAFPKEPEVSPINYKFSPIIFSAVKDFPSGTEGIDVSQTKIIYRRDAQADWAGLKNKKSKIYTYNNNVPEDIDYLLTAKSIALNLGYTDLNLISTGVSDDKYIWEISDDKSQLVINRKSKKMEQFCNMTILKSYLTSGEFVNEEFITNNVKKLLTNSKRFSADEIQNSKIETTYLRFEGENLIESPIIGSELAFAKIYIPLDGKKLVGNNYDIPKTYMYVSSLRPEISDTKKNYRFPRFSIYKNEIVNAFKGEEFDLNPLPDVIIRVINNKDFVVRGISFNGTPHGGSRPKSFKIDNISIESFEIALFDDYQDGFGKNTLIQPIYLFKGNFDTTNGERGKIILYTPAVDPKYYN